MTERPPIFYYHGPFLRPGHYWWTAGSRGMPLKVKTPRGMPPEDQPWGHVDGKLSRMQFPGQPYIHYKDGWTALALENRIWDTRPASNSVFLVDMTLSFIEMCMTIRPAFYEVTRPIEERYGNLELRVPPDIKRPVRRPPDCYTELAR